MSVAQRTLLSFNSNCSTDSQRHRDDEDVCTPAGAAIVAVTFGSVSSVTESSFRSFQVDSRPIPEGQEEIATGFRGTESCNMLCLGIFFTTYFAFRSGCIIVLPLTCELLLKEELGGVAHSPLYQLPLTVWFVMDVFIATPNALFMQRKGRRAGFVLGAVAALVSCFAAFSCLAFISQPWPCFIVLNISVAFMSIIGMGEFVRYAAAEVCTDASQRAKVVSRVITFAAVAASIGPLSTSLAQVLAKDVGLLYGYAIFFLFLAGISTVGLVAALSLKLPPTVQSSSSFTSHTPLLEILRRPGVSSAIILQVVVQFAMVTPMSATPLAMQEYLPSAQTSGNWSIALCIVAHLLGMFLPGLVTGSLIAKVGKAPMVATGLVIQALSQVVCLYGVQMWNFYVGLVLLGIGWNCAFVSSTMLLIDSHSLEERARVTSVNETLRFMANAVGSLLSSTLAWEVLNWICLSVLLTALFVLILARFCVRRVEQ